MELLVEILMYF